MIPGFLREYFERNAGGEFEWAVLKIQLMTLLAFLFAFAASFSASVAASAAATVAALAGLVVVYYLKPQRDRTAYLYFFGGLEVFAITLAWLRQLGSLSLLGGYAIAFAVFILAFFALFRRDVAYGRVVAVSGDWAVVATPFDVRSGVANGFYAVRGAKGIRTGREVRMAVGAALGQRRHPWKIVK
jgi:uncharacterized membrane protein